MGGEVCVDGKVVMFRDPLLVRVLSGGSFAIAFVWVAIYFFDVEVEVVKVLALMSVIFVGGMIAIGLILSVLLRLLRRGRDGGMLDNVNELEAEVTDGTKDEVKDGAVVKDQVS